jgi:hypothetical protein
MRALWLGSLLLVCTTGCATIISGRTQDVRFNSIPSGADVTLNNGAKTVTPGMLTLKRRGEYTATFTKESFPDRQVELKDGGNWWVLGNVLFGGLIGIIIDVATGAIHRIVPGDVIMDMANGTAISLDDYEKLIAKKEAKN